MPLSSQNMIGTVQFFSLNCTGSVFVLVEVVGFVGSGGWFCVILHSFLTSVHFGHLSKKDGDVHLNITFAMITNTRKCIHSPTLFLFLNT